MAALSRQASLCCWPAISSVLDRWARRLLRYLLALAFHCDGDGDGAAVLDSAGAPVLWRCLALALQGDLGGPPAASASASSEISAAVSNPASAPSVQSQEA